MHNHMTNVLSMTLEVAAPVMFTILAAIMMTAVYSSVLV